MVKQVAAVCEQTKDNVNSMLQDVLKKKKNGDRFYQWRYS